MTQNIKPTKQSRLLEAADTLFKSYPHGSAARETARQFYSDVEGLSPEQAARMYDILKGA